MLRGAALILPAMLAPLVAGCSGSGRPHISPVQESAQRLNAKGISEAEKGNHDAALAAFAGAYKRFGSIDDRDGMVLSLLNRARINRLNGGLEEARRAIAEAERLCGESSRFRGEVNYEQAKIALAADDPAGALRFAAQALAGAGGRERVSRHNLLGLILYRQGDTAGARREAEEALDCGAGEPDGETANAHRLLGRIAVMTGDAPRARGHFQTALELDKVQGRSRHILRDLAGLADVATMCGDTAEAGGLLQRARTVCANTAGIPECAGIEERLPQTGTDPGEP
jgi:tetratricopeptide (TPR) repeat protein